MAAARKNYTVSYQYGLNLREQPSKTSKVLAVLPFGQKVNIDPKAETPDGWFAVTTGGFVMAEFLK